jgi:hypothetical protein
MKRFLLLLLAVTLLIPNTIVLAQDFVHFDLFQVDIWPEYDRPEVLVTYKITLASDVTLPVELKLHIPAESGRPSNLVRRDMDGLFYPLSYTVKPDGQWLEVSFTTSSSQVQLEYYDPNLIRNGKQHRFDYIWPGDYFVHQMNLRVQQPANASGMDITPSLGIAMLDKPAASQTQESASQVGTARSEEDGFFYYSILFNNVYGSPLHIGIKYEKPDSALSSDLQPVKLLETVQAESSLSLALKTIPWVPLIGGIVLVLIAIFALLEGGRHLPLVAAHYDDENKGDKKVVYCQNCGKRADPKKETICLSCGQKLPPA